MLPGKDRLSFSWCGAKSAAEADLVVFGVGDEKGSRAPRKGSSGGPNAARSASLRFDLVRRKNAVSVMHSFSSKGMLKAYDAGNVTKAKVPDFSRKHARDGRILGCIGGDHSITYEVLKGIDSAVDSWGFVYIDAHPDMIASSGRYYGSVAHDLLSLKHVEAGSCVIVGVHAIEDEEAHEIAGSGIKVIDSDRITRDGIVAVSSYIKNMLPRNVYLSIDLDAVDPAFAPGVSAPAAGGLSAREILYIASAIGKNVNLGFDVMELNPRYDSGEMTAHLASQIMMSIASSTRKLK